MSLDGINNYDDPPPSTARVRRESLTGSNTIIVNNRQAPASRPSSSFQQVMDQMRGGESDQFSPLSSQQQQSVAEANQPTEFAQTRELEPKAFREEADRRVRNFEPEGEKKGRSQATEGEKPRGKEAEQRVIARGPFAERQRDGKNGNGQGKDSSNPWQGNKLKAMVLSSDAKSLQKGKIQELGQTPFLQNLRNLQAAHEKKIAQPTVFSKELIDQIVQYVRIMTKQGGEKEMEISLHEKIFKGLKLKVATSESKVEATFITQSSDVRDLFLAHRRDLELKLAEKGIEVRQINVIMIQRG